MPGPELGPEEGYVYRGFVLLTLDSQCNRVLHKIPENSAAECQGPQYEMTGTFSLEETESPFQRLQYKLAPRDSKTVAKQGTQCCKHTQACGKKMLMVTLKYRLQGVDKL